MSGFTDAVWNNILDAVIGTASFVATVTPLKLGLETTAGTATALGTEATGYTRPTVTYGAATSKQAANNVALSIASSVAQTIVAAFAIDSAGTPIRKLWGPLSTSRALQAGDSIAFAVGGLTMSGTN